MNPISGLLQDVGNIMQDVESVVQDVSKFANMLEGGMGANQAQGGAGNIMQDVMQVLPEVLPLLAAL